MTTILARSDGAAIRRSTALACLAAVLLAVTPAAQAARPDWNRLDDPMQGGIGLHAGKIGGTGLAFKWPLWWWLQVQTAGAVWNTDGNQRHNIGLQLQYLLRQDPRQRLYLVGGFGYYAHRERHTDDAGLETWRRDIDRNTGFGVGIERLLSERVSLQVDLAFTYQDDKDSVTVWPQLGLFFYW